MTCSFRSLTPRSFWWAPRVMTSWEVQPSLPFTLHMLRKMAFPRGHDSWCWPNWARPLGSLNRPVATHTYPKFTDRGAPPDEWVSPCLSVCLIRPTAVINLRDQVNIWRTPVKQDLNRTCSSPPPFVSSNYIKAGESNDCHILHQSVIHNTVLIISPLCQWNRVQKQSGSRATNLFLNILK